MAYVTMKQWCIEKAAELGVATGTVYNMISKGRLVVPLTVRKNKRVVMVAVEPKAERSSVKDQVGRWVQMKEWRETMAERLGLRPSTVAMQITRGILKPKTIYRSKRNVLALLEDGV